MFIIFTGNGKGKTTAALGQALRAVGNGKKVLMVQFIKGPWISGEDESSKKLSPYFKIVKKGLGFVGIGGDPLPLEDHIKAALTGLEYAATEIAKRKWDMVILDEIWNVLDLKLISKNALIQFVATSLPLLDNLIMTGRACPQHFMDLADLVTEMKEIKHPFSEGIHGKKGLEF